MSHRLFIVLALVAIASALPTEIKSKNTKAQTEEKKIHNPKLAKPVPVIQNEYKGRYDLEDENVKIVPVAIVTDDGPVPIMTQFLREKRQYGGGQRPGPPRGGGQRRPYPQGAPPGSQGHYSESGSPFDSPSSGGGSYGSERRPGGPPQGGSYGPPSSSYGRPGESGQGGSYGGPESSPSHGTTSHLSFTAGGPPSGQRHPGQHGSSPYEHSSGSQGGNPFGSGGPYQQYEGQEYSPQGGGPPSGYPSQGSEYSPGGSPYGRQ